MNSSSKTILKNAGSLLASQLVTWVLAVLLTVFLPRYLGATGIGQLSLATSIWLIMGVFMTFGMDTLLIKDVARHPALASDYLGTTLVLRGLIYLICLIVVWLYCEMMGYSAGTIVIIQLIGLAQVFWQFSGAYRSTLQGLETMHFVSIAEISSKTLNTVLGIAVVLLGFGLYTVGLVTILTAVVSLLVQVYFLRKHFNLKLRFSRAQVRPLLQASSPYFFSALGLGLYSQLDVLLIASLVNEETVGWYGAARRLFATFQFIPAVVITAMFPALSRAHLSDPSSLTRMIRRSFDLMLLCSVPLGLGLLIIADPLVVLLFGPAFAKSGPVLAILGIVTIFTYQNTLLGRFLISTDRQNVWATVMLLAAAVTVPLDLLLIPWTAAVFQNGALGGALSYVVTEVAMMIVGIWFLPKGSLGRSNVRAATGILVAGVAMVGVAWWLRPYFIGLPIAIGALTYISLILLLRVVPKEDLALLMQVWHKMLGRVRGRKAGSAGVTGD